MKYVFRLLSIRGSTSPRPHPFRRLSLQAISLVRPEARYPPGFLPLDRLLGLLGLLEAPGIFEPVASLAICYIALDSVG